MREIYGYGEGQLYVLPDGSVRFKGKIKTEDGEERNVNRKADIYLTLEDGNLKVRKVFGGTSLSIKYAPKELVLAGVLPIPNSLVEKAKEMSLKDSSIDGFIIGEMPDSKYRFTDSDKIFIAPARNIEIQEPEKLHEKEDLKAYETPTQMIELAFNSVLSAGVKQRIELYKGVSLDSRLTSLKGMKDAGLLRSGIDVYRLSALYSPEQLKELVKQGKFPSITADGRVEEVSIGSKALKAVQNFLNQYEKFYPALTALREAERMIESGEPVGSIIQLLAEKVAPVYNLKEITPDEVYLPVVDYQAGSGRHLEALDKIGFKNTELFGIELRQLEPKDERNKVLYGVSFETAGYTLSKDPKVQKREIIYLNPPYTNDMKIQKDSIDVLPQGVLMTGVFSAKVKNYLAKNLENGVIFVIPKELTGYQDENSPENYLFVVGFKSENLTPQNAPMVLDLSDKSPEEALNVIREFFAGNVNKLVSNSNDRFLLHQRWTAIADYVRDLFRKNSTLEARRIVNDLWTSIYNGIRKTEEYRKQLLETIQNNREKLQENIYSAISYLELAEKGERVFPDTRFFGEKPYYSINEVVKNLPLLSYYKANYPALYNLAKTVAERIKIPFPDLPSENEKIYTTNENLGIMKLAVLPKSLPINKDTVETLLEIMREEKFPEESIQTVKELVETEEAGRFLIKSTLTNRYSRGNLAFAYTSVLSVVSKFGDDLMAIPIPLKKFYDKLEEKRIINLEDKVEVIEPSEEFKKTLLDKLTQHLDAIRERLGITEDDILQDVAEENRIARTKDPKERARKAVSFVSDRLLHYNLVEFLTQEIIRETPPELLIEDRLKVIAKAKNVSIPTNVIAQRLADAYLEAPKAFYEGEDRDERVREIIKEVLEDREIPYDASLLDDLTLSAVEGIADHYSLLDNVRNSAIKLYRSLLLNERLKRLKEKDVNRAWQVLENWFIRGLGVKRHQWNEAVRTLAKYERTGEGGHLLGWEMRSGKTLVMLLTAYFGSLFLGKDSYLFPRVANLNDILYQALTFVPMLSFNIRAYRSGETDPMYRENRTAELLSHNIFPNLFGIISSSRDKVLKDFVIGGGEKVRQLLETYSYEIEKLTEIAREKLYTEGKSWSELMQDEKLRFLWDMDAYAPETRVALYYYIKRHGEDFNLTPLHLESLKDVLLRHNARIKVAKESENLLDKPPMFTFHVVPKSKIFAQNFFIEKSRKELYRDKMLTMVSDRDYEAVVKKEQQAEFKPELFLNQNLPLRIAYGSREEVLSEIRRALEDYLYFVRDDVLEAIEGNTDMSDETVEKIHQVAEAIQLEEIGSINNKTLWGIRIDREVLSNLAENNPYARFFLEEVGQLESALERVKNGWNTEKFISQLLERIVEAPSYLYPLNNYLDTYRLGIGDKEGVEIVLRGNFLEEVPIAYYFDEDTKRHIVESVSVKYREIDPNNPLYDREENIPISGTMVFKFKSPRAKKPTSIEITVMGDENHRKPFVSSRSNARQYYVYSNDVKGKAGVVIVDEVDEAADPSSLSYLAFKYLMENAEIRMGGTGTPTSGYPEMIISLLGLTAELPYETVIESSALMKENFSVWELRPELATTVIPLALLTALNSARTETEKEEVVRLLSKAKEYTSPDDAFVTFWKGLERMAKDREDLYLKYILENALVSIGQTKLASSLMNFLKSIDETSKKYGVSITPKTLPLLAFQSVSRVAPRGAGTFDPIGYVSSLKVKGATLSLNTRENLKGQPETLEFDDDTIRQYELAMTEQSYVYDASPNLFAPDSLELRIFEDFTLPKYLAETGLPQVLSYVLGNANVLKEAIVKNPKPFVERYSAKPKGDVEKLVEAIGEALDRDFGKPVDREKIREAVEFLSKSLKEGEGIKVVRSELEDGSVIYNFIRESDYYGKGDVVDNIYAVNASNPEFSEAGSISRSDIIFRSVEIPIVEDVELPESITPSKVKTLLSSRTKQANDDILNVIKTYLYNNYDWDKTKEELNLSDEKLLVAKAFWKELASLLKENAPYLRGEKERPYKEEDGKKVLLPVYVKTSSGYEVEAYLLTIALSDNRIVVPEIDSHGYLTDGNRPLKWSEWIEFGREKWNSIMKAGELPKIPYKFNYLNPSNFEIVDSYTNVGYYERIRKNAFEGVNFLLSSPRVLPEIFGIYDLLTALKEAKESGVNDKDVHVLIRASNKEVKEALKRIDRDRLESLGIHVKTFNTNAALDAESKKIKKILNMEKKNGESRTQLIVCATDETIARGVDLSHLDEIVVLGANSSGKIASQLYARLFDADKKNWGRVYTVGEPLGIRVDYRTMGGDVDEIDIYNAIENERGGVLCVPNGSFYKVSGLLDKERFIRQITSGKLINVANLKAGRDIELTNEGKYALVKKETQEQEQSRSRAV